MVVPWRAGDSVSVPATLGAVSTVGESAWLPLVAGLAIGLVEAFYLPSSNSMPRRSAHPRHRATPGFSGARAYPLRPVARPPPRRPASPGTRSREAPRDTSDRWRRRARPGRTTVAAVGVALGVVGGELAHQRRGARRRRRGGLVCHRPEREIPLGGEVVHLLHRLPFLALLGSRSFRRQ